ncbi:MAG: hypothetical protein J0I08_20785 [Rhizobiales bacterium]|nr:hypothetical protein [Hyphomicrobiales bacterium]
MVKVSQYEPSVELRPAFRQNLDANATPQTFGSDVGAGMENLAKGGMQAARSLGHVQELIDQTTARAAINDFTQRKDAALYGDDGYGQKTGQQAVEGFDDYKNKLATARRDASSKLTPSQMIFFDKAADHVETDAQRTGIQHRSSELKKFVVNTATSQTETFKQQAVSSSADPVLFEKNRMAMAHTIADLGQMQGWSADTIKAKVIEQQSDLYRLTSLNMSQSDPVVAADFVNKNASRFTPTDLMNTRNAILKPLSEVAGRDVIANVTAHGGKAGQDIQKLTDKIIAAESGGDASAKNPNSSAAGLGQFIDSTWLKMLKASRPDVAAGKSDAELLAMKSDPQLGREMTMRYAQENAATLQKAGIAPTAGNVYLAHFLGPGGAKTVLSADDDKAVDAVLPASVISANSFLRGKTVADLKAWAEKKMGGNGGVVPTYSPAVAAAVNGMPENLAARVREASFNDVNSWTIQQGVEIKAQRIAAADDYRLRMAKDDMTLTRQEILDNPVLDNGDKASLINSLTSRQSEMLETQQAVSAFQAGKMTVDPYSDQGRKLVDRVWNTIATKIEPEQRLATAEEVIRQTGVVPDPLAHAIRNDLVSGQIGSVTRAAEIASRLRTINPAALERRAGGKEILDAAVAFDHLTKTVGLAPAVAAKRLIDMRDPDKARERAALMTSEPIKDFVEKQATESEVRDIFDRGFFHFDPKLGETPATSAAMVDEYKSILKESLFDVAGDQDLAKKMASERFRRRYAVSEFTIAGPSVVARLPVEITYPADANGSRDYVATQARAALSSAGITADKVFLQPYEMTDRDYSAGRPARYQVFYTSKDGTIERYHLPFFAKQPTKEEVAAAAKAKSEHRRDLNREAAEINKELAGTPYDPNLTFPR